MTTLIRLATALALIAAPLAARADDPRPVATAATHDVAPASRAAAPPADGEAARYAERERAHPQAADFRGGGRIVIAGSTTALVVLLIILVILL